MKLSISQVLFLLLLFLFFFVKPNFLSFILNKLTYFIKSKNNKTKFPF